MNIKIVHQQNFNVMKYNIKCDNNSETYLKQGMTPRAGHK